MKPEKNYVAFDCGNSSIRVVAGLYDGRKIRLKMVHQVPNEAVSVNGLLYWDILYIFDQLKTGLQQAYLEYGPVESVGISTWGIDFGLLSKSHRLISNPLSYRNTLGEKVLQSISPEERFKIFMATGISDHPMNSLYQLLGIRRYLPEYYNEARWVMLMPDLITWLFTGNICGEPSIASTTQMLNMTNGQYSSDVLEQYQLNDLIFPSFTRHGENSGYLKQEIAESLKMPSCPFVSIASHDTASAVVSVPAQQNDFLFISSGTWSLIGTQLQAPIINKDVYEHGFSNEGGAFGTITLLKNSTGMHILQNIKKGMERFGQKYTWREIVAMAKGGNIKIPVFDPNDPVFYSPPDMQTEICDYFRKNLTIEEILASAHLSLACSYKYWIENIEKLSQKKFNEIYIIGGGCKNNYLDQLTADITGKTVIAGPEEATSLGNIGVQLKSNTPEMDFIQIKKIIRSSVSVKSYTPGTDPEKKAVLKTAYKEFECLMDP